MDQFANSELILNENNNIYHLNLSPKDIAHKIITVGDPMRVSQVAEFFDEILFSTQNREFHTTTGIYKNEKISVISTGIGVDNIDIVLNELDALVNIDLINCKLKSNKTSLTIVRIGTSGSLHPKVQCNDLLISNSAFGLDGFIYHYRETDDFYTEEAIEFERLTKWKANFAKPYFVQADYSLLQHFNNPIFKNGITITSNGFYGPQARSLRMKHDWKVNLEELPTLKIHNTEITNLEMETAGIYALAKLMGHKAISCNAILAERTSGKFSSNPTITMNLLIEEVLELLHSFKG